MRQKRRDQSSEESTDDEIIVQQPTPVIDIGDDKEEEDDDIFELSQDVTQLVPRTRYSEISPRKEKKKEGRRSKSASREIGRYTNGYRVREVNISEIPEHILTGLRIVNPKGVGCVGGLLTSEWESDAQEGTWVLRCPKDVNAADLLTGKKISLDNKTTLLSNDDDLELTQLVPNNIRGQHNVQQRLFEAISVSNETLKESVMLLLPNDNTFKIVSAPVHGHIIVRESLKELEIPEIEVPRPKRRKLPKGIKERHPVYGADFTEIIEKMEAAPSPKKKKKKSRESVAVMEHLPVNGFSSKSNYYFDVSHIKQEIESDSSQKKKKKKRRRDEDEADTSYTDYQEEPTGNTVIVDFSTPYEDTLESPRKKKSKKRKREESVDLDTSEHLLATNEIHEPPVKKLKKRKSEYRN